MSKIIMYWVRHAESCANFYNNKTTQKYETPEQNKAVSKLVEEYNKTDENLYNNNSEYTGNKNPLYLKYLDIANDQMDNYIKKTSCGDEKNNKDYITCVDYVEHESKKYCNTKEDPIKLCKKHKDDVIINCKNPNDPTRKQICNNVVKKYIDEIYNDCTKKSKTDDNKKLCDESKKKLTNDCTNSTGENNEKCKKFFADEIEKSFEKCKKMNRHDICMNSWAKNDYNIEYITKMLKSLNKNYKTDDKYTETKKITTSVLVKHQLIKSNWLFHPTITNVGIIQAEDLGKNFLTQRIDKINLVLSSVTVRTIMTAIFSLLQCDKENKKHIIVLCPFINEETNDANHSGLDFTNKSLPKEIIDEIVKIILDFVGSYNEKYSNVNNRIDIDTNFYKNYNCNEDITRANPNKFFSETLGKLKHEYNLNDNPEILIFSHGHIIKNIGTLSGLQMKIRDKATDFFSVFSQNTSVIKHMYNGEKHIIIDPEKDTENNYFVDNEINIKKSPILYSPNANNRGNLGNTGIIENEDNNICSLTNLRGKVNEPYIKYIMDMYLKHKVEKYNHKIKQI